LESANSELKNNVVNVLASKEKELGAQLSTLLGDPTDEALDWQEVYYTGKLHLIFVTPAFFFFFLRELEEAEKRLKVLSEKHKQLVGKSSSADFDPNAMWNAISNYNFYRVQWQSRKQQCMDIVNSISDGMDKKISDTMNILGVEGDEEFGKVLPPMMKEKK
jgi:hypothetical protein